MGKKKRKDLTEENLTNTDVTNTDVGFGEMAIQQTITNCSDIAKNTAAIVERIGAKLDRLTEWFEREQDARDRPFDRLKREWEDRKALLERQRLRREEQERLERLKEKAAVIIQAFLRTTAVRVKLDRAEQLWGRKNVRSWVRYTPFTLGPWWKDYRARMKAKERAAVRERACGHLNGKWMNLESDGSMETVHVKRGLVYDGLEEHRRFRFQRGPDNLG